MSASLESPAMALPADDEPVDLYGKTVDSLEIDASTLEFNSKGTIVAHKDDPSTQSPHFTIERLPPLSLADASGGADRSGDETDGMSPMPEFALKEEIGKGGMGLILRGVQLPLQREVAIKRVLPGLNAPHVKIALLREAWITGALQHPNIVPVHALGCLDDGSPVFVMKRISGVGWDRLMHDPSHAIREGSQQDHLSWNLDVLMQVCNAIHFAHDHGILHRDLKPENVMLGDYGEVYLLDWGIAVSLREKDVLPLPKARDCRKIMGTPAYMAPEMATGQGAQFSERTDVYLLGAMLHEILTGQPKHLGRELHEALLSAAMSPPYEYGPEIPEILAAICNKATHRDPGQRHESADAFRRDLEHFLSCRSSIDLSTRADETLQQLQRLCDATESDLRGNEGASPKASERPEALHKRIYELYHEAAHGFRQASRIWAQNEQAREGLEALHRKMTTYEIRQADPKAAQLHLAAMASPDPTLALEIEALEQAARERAARVERLEQLERDNDISQGRRTRAFISLIMGALFLPYYLLFGRSLEIFAYTHLCHIVTVLGFTVIVVGLSVWARDTLSKTAINRKIVQGLAVLGVLLWAQAISAWLFGKPPTQALAQISLLSALFLGLMGAFVDERMYWPALVYLLAYLLASLWPPLLFEFSGFGNMLALFLVAVLWRPDNIRRTPEERAAALQEAIAKKARAEAR